MNSRVFANGPGDRGSIPGQVMPKTKKMVLDAALLNTQHYKVRIKGKWSNPGKLVASSPTPRCSSYRKGSLQVILDYRSQLYFTYYKPTSKRHFNGVQIHWISCKGKVLGAAISKEVYADKLLGQGRSHPYWFPWKKVQL